MKNIVVITLEELKIHGEELCDFIIKNNIEYYLLSYNNGKFLTWVWCLTHGIPPIKIYSKFFKQSRNDFYKKCVNKIMKEFDKNTTMIRFIISDKQYLNSICGYNISIMTFDEYKKFYKIYAKLK
jgi:ribosomal protein S17E